MARLPDLISFAQTHGLKIGTIADLIKHRSAHESLVTRLSERPIQTAYGQFRLFVYEDRAAHQPHLALVKGRPSPERETLARVHEPLTVLDVLESESQTHSWSLAQALTEIDAHGEGVLVMLNCAPSAAVLLSQLSGATPSANPVQSASSSQLRTYGLGAAILRDLGVGKMRLMAQHRKMPSMMGFGLEVTGYRGQE
jgi:3,4-dihydroxy 2-butanone 4-phosphate synthase/GTP cyclohydrolase II